MGEVGDCDTDAGHARDNQKRDVPRATVGIKMRQACAAGEGKRQKQEYCQAARTWLIFHASPAQKHCHSDQEQQAHHVPDSELPKEILEDSEGVPNQEKQRIVASRIEIRMAKKELAHPSLQSGSRFARPQLRNMAFVKKGRQRQWPKLSPRPNRHKVRGQARADQSEQRINSQNGGKEEGRVMREHGEVEKQGERCHPSGGLLRKCPLEKIQRASEKRQKQSVLPDFRGE